MARPRMNHVLYARITSALLAGASCEQIVESTGLHPETVRNLIAVMRSQGVTFICGWAQDSRGAWSVRVHRLRLSKFEKDVPRPVSDATLARRQYPRQSAVVRSAEQPHAEPHRPAAPGGYV